MDSTGASPSAYDVGPSAHKTFSWRFGDISTHKVETDPKTNTRHLSSNRGWPSTGAKTNDTADGMAGDLSVLQRHEKTKVAVLKTSDNGG